MDIKTTGARLRRTFHYPADDDGSGSDSQPDAMDEQEQEHFIETLAANNAARDAQFRRVLLALPLITIIPYLPLLARPPVAFFALLTITSLLSTAYLLHAQPPGRTGIALLDDWVRGPASHGQQQHRKAGAGGLPPTESPLQVYLPYLNLALVLLVALMGWLNGAKTQPVLGWIGLGNLPALVYLTILAANMIMGSVDPESELTALKYQYKGA